MSATQSPRRRHAVQVFLTLPAMTDAEATAMKARLAQLLAQDFVKATIASQGVPYESVFVADPYPVDESKMRR